MAHALMENRDKAFVAPSIESFQSAAANADWKNAPGYYLVLVDQPGANTWPITGASFILMHRVQPDRAKAEEILKFFDCAYKNGSGTAAKLDYVAIPSTVADLVRAFFVRMRPPLFEPKAVISIRPSTKRSDRQFQLLDGEVLIVMQCPCLR